MKPEIAEKFSQLESLLSGMEIPTGRKASIPWLFKNLAVRNSKHANFSKAKSLVDEMMDKGIR